MNSILFPGTFDPPTLGHLDIVERASTLAAKVYVGIAVNSSKQTLLSLAERQAMLRTITSHLSNVEIVVIEGLVADYVQKHHIQAIVRGIRGASDCEAELSMASANRRMVGIETLFLHASEELAHLSSTLIRDIARSGKHLESFVPASSVERIYAAVRS